ncbi:MAG: hypothetical protein DWQ49_08945 [Bacteroidetes bacterium]|nr:MAG: hypothetical protein DWQ49_08945 [Bacteroidota bacterium]
MDVRQFVTDVTEKAYEKAEKMRRAGLLSGNLIAKIRVERKEFEEYVRDLMEEYGFVNWAELVEASEGLEEEKEEEPVKAMTIREEYDDLRSRAVWLHGTDEEKARWKEVQAIVKAEKAGPSLSMKELKTFVAGEEKEG